ncbi:MAG: response regulator [Leptospiraceae bacterium]|nr:response regulator [Leptospiraceae bacterium]MCP5495552.1 response regulator [Leptospiraceae bacterium]
MEASETIQNIKIFLSIENQVFREYLIIEFEKSGYKFEIIAENKILKNISELMNSVLLLQSDSYEPETIEISRRLKRAFSSDIKVIFLSSDYMITEDAGNSADRILQWPITFTEIEKNIQELTRKSQKILLVDDSKLIHNHIVPPLKNEGYTVYQAYDGKEGLELAKEQKPELIICDIEMPYMNGFEVCSAIRKTPGIEETYIIMSSTLGSAADIQKGFAAGVDEYITKPVVISELLDRIKRNFVQTLSGRENILLLEPEDQLASHITKSLRKQGFSVRTITNIESTITMLEKYSYEILISEMDIGAQTAMDLWMALKTIKYTKVPSVILLTSRDSSWDMKMIANMGVAGIISKPFVMDTLLASVERVLADKRAMAERNQMLKYLSKSSVRMAHEKALLNGNEGSVRAEKKTATIFFSDIVGFTSRSERYLPKEIVEQINRLFDTMTSIIGAYEGDIDKFIGDACMAYWILPISKEAVINAIKATLEIQKKVKELNLYDEIFSKDPIAMRFGLHIDEVILCDIGSPGSRIDLTLIGDGVNLTSRLESACKQYGVNVLVSEHIVQNLPPDIITREVDFMKVQGKEIPIKAFELIGEKKFLSDNQLELLKLFKDAKNEYATGNFPKARELFKESSKYENKSDLNPSLVFSSRCHYLMKNPPNSWDGIWSLKSK